MGAILVYKTMVAGSKTIVNRLIELVHHEENKIESEQDFYTGHFGATHQIIKSKLVYNGKNKEDYLKYINEFVDEEEIEKYVIKYTVLGELGYIAYKLKVNSDCAKTRSKLKLHVINGLGPGNKIIKKFNNITELKRFINNVDQPHKYLNAEITDERLNYLGYIDAETRKYKTKPKVLPKKYDYIDKLNVYGYAAYNPY